MTIPTVAWDETKPEDTALRSEGDDRIRELKTQIREVLAVDHVISSSGQADDWGRHNKVTLKDMGGTISAVTAAIVLYSDDIGAGTELFMINESGTTMQLTAGSQWIGGITNEVRMWSGTIASIPTGWRICDGNGGTPNLVAKFIRGVNSAVTNPGATGGADSLSSLVTHTHALTPSAESTHTHAGTTDNYSMDLATGGSPYNNAGYHSIGGTHSHTFTTAAESAHTHTASSANPAGGAATFDNRPAFYELAYIMRA